MSRIGSWLRGSAKAPSDGSDHPRNAAEGTKQLEDTLAAAALIMNDDVDGADAKLQHSNSSFHQLGRGVTQFMRSILGLESEMMKECSLTEGGQAFERLAAAEASTWTDLKQSQRDSNRFQSSIYPSGSEYSLAHAMAQLMSAVVALLSENLTESIRGFYKMRKAYLTLEGLVTAEAEYLGDSSRVSLVSQAIHMPGEFDSKEFIDEEASRQGSVKGREDGENESPSTRSRASTVGLVQSQTVDDVNARQASALSLAEDSDLEFVDANEAVSGTQTPANYLGHVDTNQTARMPPNGQISGNNESRSSLESEHTSSPAPRSTNVLANDGDLDDIIYTHPIDIFIHSGSNMCYGIFLLLQSMIPPAFNKLLAILGFKGDREKGIQLLWTSTKYSNICGAVAGLVLLAYYNGLIGFCDILTDSDKYPEDLTGYPKARCASLLTEMRRRYPASGLWRVEEARIFSGNRQLRQAVEVLNGNMDSKMKQVAALNVFERSMTLMFLHDYALQAKSFQDCVGLNNWSHALYYYNIGAAYVDLYRDARELDPAAARVHKEKATEFLRKAPTQAGKKKLMAKQLPFDVFVVRKLQKWEERAKAWKVDLVDAIGVSPVEEMIYLWNGTKKMSPAELQVSLEKLEWERTGHAEKHRSDLDEAAVQALLRSAILRNLGRYEEAKAELETKILNHDWSAFKGPLKDDWSCPSATYEMAVIAWLEKDLEGQDGAAKVAQCEEWLQKVSKWESYVLDSRIGLKVTTAVDTVKRHKERAQA
ncbi:MAG: Mitochondrial outer membrane protein iml2 [Claussenomyces sp. TS43310]|nr:MAG: Mitochondrial outer membrane protein iml2 [Claussenomyces sp. TS43310]